VLMTRRYYLVLLFLMLAGGAPIDGDIVAQCSSF
jgi:hypothetical protein